jgi:hypothetical protein
MNPNFITYQKFNDPALAEELAGQLEQHGIDYVIEEESTTFDPGFTYNALAKDYAVKINPADFDRANELLKEDETGNVDEIEEDYYLFSFSDVELMEVVTKADEWSAFDVVLARKLLAEKGKEISDQKIAAIQEQRIEELKQPDPPQTSWIIIGYICALAGGLLGIFIGWYLTTFKKTLPNGEQVYEYSETDRKHGRRIYYIGIVVLLVSIIYRVIPVFRNGY